MCGIAGFVSLCDEAGAPTGSVDGGMLRAMAAAIAHRGPDDEAFHEAPGVGLAFRRLAIIDVATGRQPMSTPDGLLTIVFNGEIYNHRALRAELERAGHRFQTHHSDTETLLLGFREWGLGGVCRRAVGMFAFAIWDAKGRKLHLGRDRVGKKPLFLARTPRGLAFASEIGALHPVPGWDRSIDPRAVWDYLSLQYVPGPGTIHRGVQHLPGAHVAVFDPVRGDLGLERYWQLEYEPKSVTTSGDARGQCVELLERAVVDRLESEVPLGVFLSGGIDSAAVTALARRHVTGELRTYSIGFREEGFNELPAARRVAGLFSTRHEEFMVEPDAVAVLPAIAACCGQPFADAASIPMWHLCRMARKSVTVALTGDGGDESFAGYPRTLGYPHFRWWGRLPRALRALLQVPLRAANAVHHPFGLLRSVERVNRAHLMTPRECFAMQMAYASDAEKHALAGPSLGGCAGRDTMREVTVHAVAHAAAKNDLDAFLGSDIHTYLENCLLVKADRTSMACGLEARSPFLDHRLMEFAARLPTGVKLPRLQTKAFLRDALRGTVPDDILNLPKAGFSVPTTAWLRGPLRTMLRDMLLDSKARGRGWFRPGVVERLVDEHVAGRATHKKVLWVLLNFEIWARGARVG